jgi:hypothetical protein
MMLVTMSCCSCWWWLCYDSNNDDDDDTDNDADDNDVDDDDANTLPSPMKQMCTKYKRSIHLPSLLSLILTLFPSARGCNGFAVCLGLRHAVPLSPGYEGFLERGSRVVLIIFSFQQRMAVGWGNSRGFWASATVTPITIRLLKRKKIINTCTYNNKNWQKQCQMCTCLLTRNKKKFPLQS